MKTKTKFKVYFLLVMLIFSLINIAYSKPKIDCEDLSGVWLMTEKTPISSFNSNPYGTINTKMYFDSFSLKVTLSNPDRIEKDKEQSAVYSCQNNELIYHISENDKINWEIVTLDSNSLKLRIIRNEFTEKEVEHYQNYSKQHHNSQDNIFEPYSIEVLTNNRWGKQLNISDINYDNNDYDSYDLQDRILGAWEVNKYENIPRNDLPPYGFLNDIYIISDDQYCVYSQYKDEKICSTYSLEKTVLKTNFNSNTLSEDLSFNKWGHMVLTSMGVDVSLKLISKNTDKIPQIPVKVILTSVK